MAQVYITDYGTAKIVATRMYKSAALADNLDTVMEMLCLDLLRITKEQIDSGGARGGSSYPQLKIDTQMKKGSYEILRTEGAYPSYSAFTSQGRFDTLYRSVTSKEAPYQIWQVTKAGFQFGTKRPWAFVHQYGSDKRRIPKREFLHVLDTDMDRWKGIIGGYIVEPFDRPVEPGAP